MKPWKFICGCKDIGEITYTAEDNIRYYRAVCKNCGRGNAKAMTDLEFLCGAVDLQQKTIEELAASFGGEFMYDYF